MGRLLSFGFENNQAAELGSTTGTPTISTTTVRSGTYAQRCNTVGTSIYSGSTFISPVSSDTFYVRFYMYMASLPSADTNVFFFMSGASTFGVRLRLSTTGRISLQDATPTTIATSSVLNTGQWYCVEVMQNDTSSTIELKIGGVSIGSSSSANVLTTDRFLVGVLNNVTVDLFFDDIAVNNTSGSNQNTWAGEGKIVHLRVDGAGDNAADSGAYTDIDEVTPNDATDFINLDTDTSIGDYTCQSSASLGIGATDIISLVAVGVRIREEVVATTSYQLRIKSASGGTVSMSTPTDAGNTTWRANPNGTTSFFHQLASYNDPTTGIAWTPTGTNSIDNMQIGVASLSVNNIDVSALWAVVEYIHSTTVTLVVNDASHGHIVDNISTLTQVMFTLSTDLIDFSFGAVGGVTLVVDDTLHSHSADAVVLTEKSTLVVNDTLHTHLVDNIDTVQDYQMVVADTLHGHTVDNVPISSAGSLGVADALHAHNVDNITLTQKQILVIQETLHSHLVDGLTLTSKQTVVVQETLHSHTVDSVVTVEAGAGRVAQFFPFFG